MLAGPLFAFRSIPMLFRIGFPFALAVVIYPTVAGGLTELPGGSWGYGLAIFSELGVGLLLGAVSTIILNSLRMAGQMIDLQIGYSMSAMADPMNGMQSTLVAQFMYLLGLVLFLSLDGHHVLIVGLVKSYQMLPLDSAVMSGGAAQLLIKSFAGAIVIALQVAAPVLAVLLISDLTLGFLSRTTPQINVFLTGFLVKIMVGMLTLAYLVPFLGTIMRSIIDVLENDLYSIIKALSSVAN